jgi:hypothetical protein
MGLGLLLRYPLAVLAWRIRGVDERVNHVYRESDEEEEGDEEEDALDDGVVGGFDAFDEELADAAEGKDVFAEGRADDHGSGLDSGDGDDGHEGVGRQCLSTMFRGTVPFALSARA